MKILDEAEIAHTYIGKVRQFMRDFGIGDRSPAALETALDIAMKVFLELCPTEDAAHDALKSFVETHYLPVWRAIESDTDTSTI